MLSPSRLRRIGCKFGLPAAANADGMAAVEFALILPLMLTIYFGAAEITQGVRASRKVDLVASALANLASQQLTCSSGGSAPCLAEADMTGANGVFTAAAAILSPYDASTLKMTLSQIRVLTDSNNNLVAKVDWSVVNNGGTARPCNGGGSDNALLAGNLKAGSANYQSYMPRSYTASGAPTGYMIVADVSYKYMPGFGYKMFQWNDATTLLTTYNVGYYRNRNASAGAAGRILAQMTSGLTQCDPAP